MRQTFDSEAYDYDEVSSATYTYNKSARSQRTGSVTFDTLGEGIYELRETDKPEGYDSKAVQDRWIIKVEKTENGLQAKYDKEFEKKYYEEYANHDKKPNKEKDNYYTTYIKNGFDKKSNLEQKQVGEFNYVLTNTKTTTDLKWKKVNQNKETIAKETKFIMLKNSDDPNNLEAAKGGNSSSPPYELIETDGTFEVNNLSKGIYTLIETKAPDGFKQMNRQIVIQIYEDETDNYKLKKKFYEMKKDANGNNELVDKTDKFLYLGKKVDGSVDTDLAGTFKVINEEKQYFYLTKGFLTDSNGRKAFNHITKGELHLKLTNEKDDTDVFRATIDLAKQDQSGYYKFDVDGIKNNEIYILEEEKAPEGYKLSTNKYKIKFITDTQKPGGVNTILQAVLDKDGNELKNEKGQFILEDGTLVDNFNAGTPIQVINEKNSIEFTKVGKDRVKGEDGKFIDKEDPLKDVEFILQKQDPKDWDKENNGYYPVTKDIEFIKKDDKRFYILRADGTKDYKVGVSNVTIDNSAYKGKSDNNGKFTFEGLTDGFYQIMEPNAPEGFMQVNGPVKKFRVLDGKIYIYDKVDDKFVEKEVADDNIGTLGKIANEKPGKGEFELTKVDENNGPLDNIEFTLHETDAGEKQVGDAVYKTDSDGKIKFTGLPYGYYWLKEKKTKNGYILDTKKRLIALGGGDWKVPDKQKDDVSKSIVFDGDKVPLVSTGDKPNSTTVYPNKAEGIFAKFNFKIDENTTIKSGDYFTLKFSDNVDLDGIFKTNDEKGKLDNEQLDIIGPAGLLAKAKINDDRKSITYTFTNYVEEYKPDFMSVYLQLFPNRRKVDHKQDITVTADIGNNADTTSTDYHYSDSINIDYRGNNSHTDSDGQTQTYDGYQNPKADISSYMLRLDPDGKTFTAILYLNPWNNKMLGKTLTFTTREDILVNENLSVKTYIKTGNGSHTTEDGGWQEGDLPDSYDIYEKDENGNLKVRSDLSLISDSEDKFYWHPTKTWTDVEEVNPYYDSYDYYQYDNNSGTYKYYKYVTKNNRSENITRQIDIPNRYLNREGDPSTATYVVEIKGQLKDEAKSLKTWAEETHYNYRIENGYKYKDSYNSHFKTWSQFFNPSGKGGASKEIKLINFKNKIEFIKVDGGVISNVVDKSLENPESLKDLGIGLPLKGAKFKLEKDGFDLEGSVKESDENGIFSWEGLAQGTYKVIETKTPDDEKYDKPKDGLISTFEVDDRGNIVNVKENKQILENYRKAEIRIRKTDKDGQTLTGAEFQLARDDNKDYTPNIGDQESEGVTLFKDLKADKYTLTEKKAPKGYTINETEWKLEVTKDGKVKWLNSFNDENDTMKEVAVKPYTGDTDKEKLKSEILGIDEANKTFRQKITIKAKSSELKNARLILDSTNTDLKLSQANTKVRLVQANGNTIKDKDNTTYTVQINNGEKPNLTLRITPPYRQKGENNPVGSTEENPKDEDVEREYQFIVDMPYKDDTRIGAKATYQIGTTNQTTGKVEFGENVIETVLDKYAEKSNLTISEKTNVDMKSYADKYLARDVNLITLDIANIKNPDIYFKKIDADKPDKALAGAEFAIERKQENGDDYLRLDPKGNTIQTPTAQTVYWTATSDENGKFAFENIPIDGEYQIVETKAPEGYALVETIVFKFDVENGKIIYKDKKDNKISKIDLDIQDKNKENSDTNRILITNKKAEYPHTGGPGVWIGYTILGLIIMFVAVLTYSKRKDKLIV